MKLGVLTAPFENKTLKEVANWAESSNFHALEIACWPLVTDEIRRYAGTAHIDVANISEMQASEIVEFLSSKNIIISGLGYYPNPLHPDAQHRNDIFNHLKNIVDCAKKMKVPVINTFCGGDAKMNIDENWKRAQEIWPEFIKYTKDQGIQLAFENCPMIFSYDEWPGGHNIAYSPNIWRRIIEEWNGAVGMNFDPSHLILQMINQKKFICEFGPHIKHVHAKDLMIDTEGLYEHGIMSKGMGWQVPRMPGLGDVNWSVFFSELFKAGYDGSIIIEHEDRNFEETEELLKKGFLLARDNLSPYIK
ncbi:MAG: AP endonuclease [Parcubacteria group bacterium]|jgi:sugar phosphate isomerase/epimerase|nr:AP endonuclease [Parcubacteria group bacterium]